MIEQGLIQKQGLIQRTLHEIGEDIHFRVLAVTAGEVTPSHQRYPDAFRQEEFDQEAAEICSG